MDVLNMNSHQVSVKLKAPDGSVDYATVAAGRRVTLPDGYVVNNNWLATAVKVKAFDSPTSKVAIELGQATVVPSVPPQTISVKATAPAAAPANVKAD